MLVIESYWYLVNYFAFKIMRNPFTKKHFLGRDFRKK